MSITQTRQPMIDWPDLQLRHIFSVVSGATPESGESAYWDGEILWVTPEDVGSLEEYRLSDTRRKITVEGYENCGTKLTPKGSIVLTKRAPIGQLAVLEHEACSNQGCFLLTAKQDADPRFYYYLLSTRSDWLQALGRGSTFMELSTDDLKALRIPFPPFPEQQAIADYLDRETAQLDALIAEKERLLELLAEKRRALITRAVIRGVDDALWSAPAERSGDGALAEGDTADQTDAPRPAKAASQPPRSKKFRDSGLPWLGKIPAHWQTKRLAFLRRQRVVPEPYSSLTRN